MHPTFWSLLPFLTVIPVALLTRQVLPGLVVGLLIGSYMMQPHILGGLDAAVFYLLKEIAVSNNVRLLVFLYGFGSFVGLIRVTGGVAGFANWMNQRIQTVRGAFILTWLSSLATFMAPDFRIITVGPVMQRVFQRLKVPDSKVAFIIDATSTPLIALTPIGTAFVGYMVGLIASSARHIRLGETAYEILLQSLPYNFFAILMLLYALYLTFFTGNKDTCQSEDQENQKDCPPTIQTPFRASPQVAYMNQLRETPQDTIKEKTPQKKISGASSEHEPDSDFPDPIEIVSETVTPRAIHLVVPLLVLLCLTFLLTWWDGASKASTFWGALIKADASKAMLEAIFITLLLMMIWYTLFRQPLARLLFGFMQGGNEMMGVNLLLALVWALTAVSTDLGFIPYTKNLIGSSLPALWLTPAFFLIGCVIAYILGSSFGSWAILMPLGFSLAAGTAVPLPLIAGAVFASGTFGGFASLLSDNTVAMATVMKLPLMKYSRMKLKASLLVGIASLLLYVAVSWIIT
ncbi:Na+/H+ antiporter NhaC family protein [Marininema halotolerans]|uniref:Na+/H+ antiporter family protein n=1 Tax=Marininema halotolerans TaxID=1155944 RepID=A0A1I6PTM1_9BACL|nr:Na+/H+ antiporter NhaC family protein [Marininema halotolerans]SFS43561.1 Na+/H+ antiporter family protein [Marininema halotolerans]